MKSQTKPGGPAWFPGELSRQPPVAQAAKPIGKMGRCVGGGGGSYTWSAGGGGGGGLGYVNGIQVTPGKSYTVVAGNKGNKTGNTRNTY